MCEDGAVPANCATAVAEVTVNNPIVAEDDSYTTTAGSTVSNVLDNDTLNGNPVNLDDVILSGGVFTQTGITLNTNGTVTVEAGTPAGVYTATYTICEDVRDDENCDDAVITIVVEAQPLDCSYWISNCLICACYENYPATFTLHAGTNGGLYCPADNTGEWSYVEGSYVGLDGVTPHPTFANANNYVTEVEIPYPGRYVFRYTFPDGNYVEAAHTLVDSPKPSIEGPSTVSVCGENEFTVTDGRDLQHLPLEYEWTVTGGTIIGSTTSETVVVKWDNELTPGVVSVTARYQDEAIDCETTVGHEVTKKNPTFAGQVKYWNQEETYMPSPYQTCDYCTCPPDYFFGRIILTI